MIADKVPLRSHAADDVRAGIHKMPGHEKRRRNLLFAEDIQYLGDIAVIIPAVEGQVDGLFLRIPEAEVGIILKKRRIVGDGGLSANPAGAYSTNCARRTPLWEWLPVWK